MKYKLIGVVDFLVISRVIRNRAAVKVVGVKLHPVTRAIRIKTSRSHIFQLEGSSSYGDMLQTILVSTVLLGAAFAAPPAQEDCSKSEAPHSAQCLSQWFLDAGCQSLWAVSPKNEWKDEADIDKIKKEMADLYEKATGKDATEQDVRRCRPLTPFELAQQQCYNALTVDCKKCSVNANAFMSYVDTKCVSDCIAASDSLQEKCPTLTQTLKCDKVLSDKCGKCVVKGLFGQERLDDDWYEAVPIVVHLWHFYYSSL